MIIHGLSFFYIYILFIIFKEIYIFINYLLGFEYSYGVSIIYYSIKNKIVNIYLKYIYVY